jgi:hypothetical protein
MSKISKGKIPSLRKYFGKFSVKTARIIPQRTGRIDWAYLANKYPRHHDELKRKMHDQSALRQFQARMEK